MRRVSVGTILVLVCALTISISLVAQTNGNAAGKSLKNPAKASPESIAAGKEIYTKRCIFCHGETGKGDGPVAASTKGTKPSNLADAKWDHGSTDGEIFVAIRDGIGPKFDMKGSKGKISDPEIWNVVNFIRSLGCTAGK